MDLLQVSGHISFAELLSGKYPALLTNKSIHNLELFELFFYFALFLTSQQKPMTKSFLNIFNIGIDIECNIQPNLLRLVFDTSLTNARCCSSYIAIFPANSGMNFLLLVLLFKLPIFHFEDIFRQSHPPSCSALRMDVIV